jgi:hypothetical protein
MEAIRTAVLKSFLENGPKTTALLSFFVLMLTVFHDWGYFWIIGSKFQSVQTPYDYIANSITWLPLSLALVALHVGAVGALVNFTIQRPTDQHDFQSAPLRIIRAKIKKQFDTIAIAGTVTTLLMGACSYVYKFPHKELFGSFALMTAYVAIFAALVPRAAFWDPLKQDFRLALLISAVPIIVILSFIGGVGEALYSLSSRQNVYALRQKDASYKQVSLLRSLDKGVLTYDFGNHQIAFTRWDVLNGIDHAIFPAQHKGSTCDVTEHICSTPEPP